VTAAELVDGQPEIGPGLPPRRILAVLPVLEEVVAIFRMILGRVEELLELETIPAGSRSKK